MQRRFKMPRIPGFRDRDYPFYEDEFERHRSFPSNFTHIIAYDNSGSTSQCAVEDLNSNSCTSYFAYVKGYLMRKLKSEFPNEDFIYIAWNTDAKITDGIVDESDGGTDPTRLFELLEKQFSNKRLYVHFLTDGDIIGYSYRSLHRFRGLKIDIHYLGRGDHNIDFYQNIKHNMGSSCNVYVNNQLVEVIDRVEDGKFYLTEQEIDEILSHDYGNMEVPCPAGFNKLLGTLVTYSKNERYKEIIRDTIASLVAKSRGNYSILFMS